MNMLTAYYQAVLTVPGACRVSALELCRSDAYTTTYCTQCRNCTTDDQARAHLLEAHGNPADQASILTDLADQEYIQDVITTPEGLTFHTDRDFWVDPVVGALVFRFSVQQEGRVSDYAVVCDTSPKLQHLLGDIHPATSSPRVDHTWGLRAADTAGVAAEVAKAYLNHTDSNFTGSPLSAVMRKHHQDGALPSVLLPDGRLITWYTMTAWAVDGVYLILEVCEQAGDPEYFLLAGRIDSQESGVIREPYAVLVTPEASIITDWAITTA